MAIIQVFQDRIKENVKMAKTMSESIEHDPIVSALDTTLSNFELLKQKSEEREYEIKRLFALIGKRDWLEEEYYRIRTELDKVRKEIYSLEWGWIDNNGSPDRRTL